MAAQLQDLGARVQEGDRLELDTGALGDAAHLLDVGGVEGLHLRHVLTHQVPDGRRVEPRALELHGVVADAQRDAVGGLPPILPPALAGQPRHLDEGEGLGHRA